VPTTYVLTQTKASWTATFTVHAKLPPASLKAGLTREFNEIAFRISSAVAEGGTTAAGDVPRKVFIDNPAAQDAPTANDRATALEIKAVWDGDDADRRLRPQEPARHVTGHEPAVRRLLHLRGPQMDDPDDLPEALTIGRLTLRLQPSPAGPLLSAADPATEPLAFVVNAAVGGVLEGLDDHLAADRSMSRHGLFAIKRADLDGPPPGADEWRALTGEDPGDDAYLVGAEFLRNSLLVPRETLIAILRELRERHAR
jgi:hypothetical protein